MMMVVRVGLFFFQAQAQNNTVLLQNYLNCLHFARLFKGLVVLGPLCRTIQSPGAKARHVRMYVII